MKGYNYDWQENNYYDAINNNSQISQSIDLNKGTNGGKVKEMKRNSFRSNAFFGTSLLILGTLIIVSSACIRL